MPYVKRNVREVGKWDTPGQAEAQFSKFAECLDDSTLADLTRITMLANGDRSLMILEGMASAAERILSDREFE
ncbi:hypothetical protein EAS64_33655 [Trebonia kvetii]|uniref:Uncharacterized protein n=1 Tax=Trebonia kvetii TaxID=2480626 RepID=A0A6P2BRD3_9ACTN|nr:hypothetical protein [Trebonia kvetii]TVZ01227.1 hypothetical protein EAS64_33655 [Trebonia kvetii]